MDVAAMSVAMSQQQVRSEASLSVMKNVKEVAEQQGSQLVKMLNQSQGGTPPHPSIGNAIDVKA
ncbi:Putative motility protein [Lentibacillus persicus]|uniref:Putative motility protein n=1 Tax=Lentibacillus persicus TaxID=640948 RepID=A0A1I1XSS3_9BACI|nr:YjfB family protein [Lentibacillus persicus]SFE10417.1 Putative motility protein [Lentibacillus persicus]